MQHDDEELMEVLAVLDREPTWPTIIPEPEPSQTRIARRRRSHHYAAPKKERTASREQDDGTQEQASKTPRPAVVPKDRTDHVVGRFAGSVTYITWKQTVLVVGVILFALAAAIQVNSQLCADFPYPPPVDYTPHSSELQQHLSYLRKSSLDITDLACHQELHRSVKKLQTSLVSLKKHTHKVHCRSTHYLAFYVASHPDSQPPNTPRVRREIQAFADSKFLQSSTAGTAALDAATVDSRAKECLKEIKIQGFGLQSEVSSAKTTKQISVIRTRSDAISQRQKHMEDVSSKAVTLMQALRCMEAEYLDTHYLTNNLSKNVTKYSSLTTPQLHNTTLQLLLDDCADMTAKQHLTAYFDALKKTRFSYCWICSSWQWGWPCTFPSLDHWIRSMQMR